LEETGSVNATEAERKRTKEVAPHVHMPVVIELRDHKGEMLVIDSLPQVRSLFLDLSFTKCG